MSSFRTLLAAASLLLTLSEITPVGAQMAPPTRDSLDAIQTRGRELAAYDSVGWHATDAVMETHPVKGAFTTYIVRRFGASWEAVFGTPDQNGNFLINYRVTPAGSAPGFQAVKDSTVDTSFYARAARAIDLTRHIIGPTRRPYNVAVLPRSGGGWWVYYMPAQLVDGVYPLGADVRFIVSTDGRSVITKRQLHNAIIEYDGRSTASKPQASMHAAVLDNIPEDTDVFTVLTRRPQVPEFIVTDEFVYKIEIDGTIKLMGRRKDILKPA